MATMTDVKSLSFEAGGDLSADQFKFVVQAADGQVDLVGASTVVATGVLLNNPSAAGQAATVAYAGVVKVVAAEICVPGSLITSDASGLAIIADTATHEIHGVSQSDAQVGELVEVRLGAMGKFV